MGWLTRYRKRALPRLGSDKDQRERVHFCKKKGSKSKKGGDDPSLPDKTLIKSNYGGLTNEKMYTGSGFSSLYTILGK